MNAALEQGDSHDRAYLLDALTRNPIGASKQISLQHAVRAIPGIVAATRDTDPKVSTTALRVAAEIAPDSQPVRSRLHDALTGEDPELTHTAALILAEIDSDAGGLADVLNGIVFREGRPRDEALRSAQLSVLNDLRAGRIKTTAGGAVAYPEHPWLWAGAILVGAP